MSNICIKLTIGFLFKYINGGGQSYLLFAEKRLIVSNSGYVTEADIAQDFFNIIDIRSTLLKHSCSLGQGVVVPKKRVRDFGHYVEKPSRPSM